MARFEKRGGAQFFGRDGFGRRSEGRSDRRGGGERFGGGERQMYKAVCSNCGKDCEIPFRPTNDKPVYCNDCFSKMRGGNERNQDRRPRFNDRPRNGGFNQDKELLQSINKKLDRILNFLQPQVAKPETPKPPVVQPVAEKSGTVEAELQSDAVTGEVVKKEKVVKVKRASKKKESTEE